MSAAAATAAVASGVEESEESASHAFSRAFVVGFASDTTCVARMRRLTAHCLRWWGLDQEAEQAHDLAENAVLCVSELVTNAVRHGHGDGRLSIVCTVEDLYVEVADGNPEPAELRSASDDDTTGRGLVLVDALSTDWGVNDGGKTTWCVFNIPEGML
ncbi:ATP-binding protein [Streptomyces sp. NBC_01304]|uniref:ATP-binding protein n=1 Tax=Streptomyces sp. NBC_01304 TaxID=2903818 RepID=UPI002E14283F|nr:ATP-binding protein [Streptomyces sp. NBC_01304]